MIVAALAIVVAGFFFATYYAYARTLEIRALVGTIATDAMPSVVHLTTARGELRRIEALVALHLDELGPTVTDVEGARDAYERELRDYLALPTFPGERELSGALDADMHRIDRAVERTIDLARTSDGQGARKALAELAPEVERASVTIERAIAINVAHARDVTLRIEHVRRAAGRVAIVLDAVCALLAIAVGVLAYRAVRATMELAELRRLALQRTNDELETFASRVAHDILGPLTPVAMALELAKRRDANAHARGIFDAALRSVERIREMVEGLLEFARSGAEPDTTARADVAAVVAGVIEDARPLAAGAHVELAAEAAQVPDVRCTGAVLGSIVSNLVRNAIKYMGASTVREVRVRAFPRHDRVRIEVVDTGPGMPAELGERVFEPYVRPRGAGANGVGLGLATVKRLVDAHGGAVGFEPGDRGGTRFWVELPSVRAG